MDTNDPQNEEAEDSLKTSVYSDEKPGTSPLGVVPRSPEPEELDEVLNFAASELGLLYGALDQERLNMQAASGEEWQWEDYQLRYFANPKFWIANKPRQTGISAAFGAKALAKGILAQGNYTGIFVSYKKEEAISKINYVKAFLDCLPVQFRKKIIRDPLHLIEWKNPNGTISKIISHAQKPVRGHHGDAWLDEFHFFQQDKLIYDSIVPVTSQVGGTIDIASTPFGKAGVFYDIVTDNIRYPEFTREWIYWWWCRRYLKDPSQEFLEKAMIEGARIMASGRETASEEIIEMFGNDKIRTQFNNLDLETFKQEFEGLFVDEQAFFFSRALIMACMYDNKTLIDEYNPLAKDFTIPIEEALADNSFHIEKEHPNVNFQKFDSLQSLIAAMRRGDVTPNLYAGVDVGATRHSSDIRLLEELPMQIGGQPTTLQVERHSLNRRKWPLKDMEAHLITMMKMGFIRKMNIDATGIGYQMAQTLEQMFPGRVNALKMNGSGRIRNEAMNNLRARMSGNGLALAYDRQTIEDLHSIKSVISTQKNQRFITEEKRLHHGDGAWSISFASLAGTKFGKPPRSPLSTGVSFNLPGWSTDLPFQRSIDEIEGARFEEKVRKHAERLKSKRSSFNKGSMFGIGGSGRLDSDNLFSRLDPGPHIDDYDR